MANTIGTAYIQIEPTAEGISGKIENQLNGELSGAGEKGGHSFAKGFGSAIGGLGKVAAGAAVAAGTAIAGLTKEAVTSFADYEQLAGGIETLFGKTADSAMENASEAFRTSGLSANQYMETVTGFAAALKAGLGDEYAWQMANYADQAVVDMADNANKMGTSMESIQNAYQGFAKQNFTMLDNLKLGYGGTKEEMERLMRDAEELEGYELGSLDMNNFADVVEAIHIIQENMGIAGTTSKEAATTISGSFGMLKASWQNLITGIGAGDDLQPLIDNLVSSVGSFAGNLLPVIETAISGISDLIKGLAPVIATELPKLISDNLPTLLDAAITTAIELINGVLAVLPSIIDTLIQALPIIINAVIQIALGIMQALPEIVSMIAERIPEILPILIDAIITSWPLFMQAGIDLIIAIVEHLPEIITALVEAIPYILETLANTLIENAPIILESLKTLGLLILDELKMAWETIKTTLSNLWNTLKTNASAKFNEFSANFKAWLAQLPEQIGYYIGKMVAEFINKLHDLITKTPDTLNQVITEIKAFGTKLIENGIQMVTDFKNHFIEGFNELPDRMIDIGHNIVEGIKTGFTNAWNKFRDWVSNLLDGLVQGFVDNLKIGSPSKVFRDEVGRWIPAGLAEGIDAGLGTLNASMEDMSMAVSPSNMSDVTPYSPRTGAASENGTNQALYDLLSRYLPMLENQTNVNVSLEGDAQGLFNVVRHQNKIYRRMNGESAFA